MKGKKTPSSSSSSSSSSGKKDKESPFASFALGVVLICFALPMVWMNERKDVKIYKVVGKAREAYKESDSESLMDNLNFELVHTTGML